MKFKVVFKNKDASTNERMHRLGEIWGDLSQIINLATTIQNNKDNLKNAIEKGLPTDTYVKSNINDINIIRRTLDKVEKNLNNLK